MLGEHGALYVCFYLFTILGFGFRIGTRPMWICQAASIAGYIAVISISPIWSIHPVFAFSNLLLLAIVPLYATILIKKLIDARAFAELESLRLAAALESAEQANQAKRRFVSSMSHELRTPLNALIGMTDLLQSTPLAIEQKDMVDTMEIASHTMLALIEDVLDFSKIEAGKLVVEEIDLDLRRLIGTTVDIFKFQARQRALILEYVVAPEVPAWLRGDPRLLRQVLINLLSNAVKFTEMGSIHCRVRVVHAAPAEVCLRFEVEDTGIGIEEALQDKIFESFTQADESISRRYGGTGLGTTISKQLVELMGGNMGMQSQPGAGSLFWFEVSLPRHLSSAPHAIDALSASPPAVSHHAYRVLVAEDNPVNAKVLRKVLERAGHACTLVENGRDALDWLNRQEFDIAIFDMNMPAMNGLETTKIYRATHPFSPHLPIIIFSASVITHSKQEAIAAGADDFLAKPIQVELLLAAIERLVCSYEPNKNTHSFLTSSVDTLYPSSIINHDMTLDYEALVKLNKLGGNAFINDLLTTFIDDNRIRLSKLQDLSIQSDFDEFKKVVHTMLSSAAAIGAISFKEICQQIEELSENELIYQAGAALTTMQISFEKTYRAIENYKTQKFYFINHQHISFQNSQ